MSAIGRNDPCPCDSGLKYKKCCMDKDAQRRIQLQHGELLDNTPALVHQFMVSHEDDYRRQVEQLGYDVLAYWDAAPHTRLRGEPAADLVAGFLAVVEERIQALLSKRSSHFWLYLTRQLAFEIEGKSSVFGWNPAIARHILDLAIAKHGLHESDAALYAAEFLETPSGLVIVRDLKPQDVIDTLLVKFLVGLHVDYGTDLRRVWQGAEVIPGDGEVEFDASEDVERLVEAYEERMLHHHGQLAHFGSAVRTDEYDKLGGPGSIPHCMLNAGRRPWSAFYAPTSKGIVNDPGIADVASDYVFAPLAIAGVKDLLDMLDVDVRTLHAFDASEFVTFVWAVATKEFRDVAGDSLSTWSLLRTALTYTPAHADGLAAKYMSTYVEGMEALWDVSVSDVEASEVLSRLAGELTMTAEDCADIDFLDAYPPKLFRRAGGWLVCDLSKVFDAVFGLFAELSGASGASGNLKGDRFEAHVKDLIMGRPELEPWLFGTELHARNGLTRQVDAAFVRNGTLYVVECKAVGVPRLLRRGEPAARKKRWQQLRRYCQQAATLAVFLGTHRSGRDYAVPEGVTDIQWIVVTPGVEYIPTVDATYWLTPTVPRICTPEELVESVCAPRDGRSDAMSPAPPREAD